MDSFFPSSPSQRNPEMNTKNFSTYDHEDSHTRWLKNQGYLILTYSLEELEDPNMWPFFYGPWAKIDIGG